MVRTFIVYSILTSLLVFLVTYANVDYYLVRAKGEWMYYLGFLYSPLAVFMLQFTFAYEVIHNFLRKG